MAIPRHSPARMSLPEQLGASDRSLPESRGERTRLPTTAFGNRTTSHDNLGAFCNGALDPFIDASDVLVVDHRAHLVRQSAAGPTFCLLGIVDKA